VVGAPPSGHRLDQRFCHRGPPGSPATLFQLRDRADLQSWSNSVSGDRTGESL